MRRCFLLQALAVAVLALGVLVVGGRLLRLAGPALRLDVAGRDPATLPDDLRQLLRHLDGNVEATLFVSTRQNMPSQLRDVEPVARALLDAMVDAGGGRFSYRVLDPDLSGAAGARYAAARRVSPIRVRRVVDDAESQVEIWSSLVFARQGHPRRDDILVQGIENAHLPYLGALVAAHLRAAQAPPQPTFAVSAPPGYEQLPQALSQFGPVVGLDIDASGQVPQDIDVLFWLEPRRVSPAQVAQLRRFLASGRTAILAGSAFGLEAHADADGEPRFRVEGTGDAWARLLQPFGLEPVADLLTDRNHGPAVLPVDGVPRPVEAPFCLRNLPAFRDFRPFRSPARGALAFVAASPLRVDPPRVEAAGYEAHVAATTTEWVRAQPLPSAAFTAADLDSGLVVPKQNLMVLLSPRDPWAGQLLVLASASPLRDGILTQAGYGHRVFLADLARTFAHPERLVRLRVDRRPPPPLPALFDAARIGWRLAVVVLVPLALLLAAALRLRDVAVPRAAGPRTPAPADAGRGYQRWRGPVAVAALLGLFAVLRPALGSLRLDATADDRHTPAPQVVERLRGAGDLHVDLVQSPAAAQTPALREAAARARRLFADAGVPVREVRAEGGAAAGLRPFEIDRVRRDTTVTTRVLSGLRLARGGRSAIVSRLDGATAAHLDFLVATALARLDSAAPVVAVVADLPRLSPAEALEDYQRKGLSAPQGVDVYSHAKALLADYGYDVQHVSTREPEFPAAPDAVVWFQPRRDATPILTRLSAYLAGGGHAVVALQHFNIQQRQYRGAGFETVHWPQPQFQDFDRYLRLFGVEQVREVLFDRTAHHLELDTQVNRTAEREYDPQRVALPFLIRAVSADYAADTPLTRNLGDLLFIWGNRFALDAAALRAAGIRARTLVTTTPQAWAYAWRGGWLPPEVLQAPDAAGYLGRQSLVVELQGTFPAVTPERTEAGGTDLVPHPGTAPGRLLLIGDSEMFKDGHLDDPAFAHDQLLLNAVADAAWGPQLAGLQARHRRGVQGFAVQGTAVRTLWRLAVIGGGPLLLGLAAVGRRRRAPGPRLGDTP